ncbi:MAG: MarR family winged helix-turn-helix transcriptional regulator [Cellulosilyticaceae bacterium]
MELLKWLSITDRYTKMQLDRKLTPLGLNSSQYIYILRICRDPGMTQDQLLSLFYIHPSNITRSLTQLEKLGFIKRESHKKDKRTYCLYPTDKALEANRQIIAILGDWHASLLQGFTDQEKELLATLLHRAGENAIAQLRQEIEQEN